MLKTLHRRGLYVKRKEGNQETTDQYRRFCLEGQKGS